MTLKQVTVFGGSGFVGRHLIKRLAKTGALIRVPTRQPDRAKFLRPMGNVGQITPLRVDIHSDDSLTEMIAGSDAVVNLIGILFEAGGQRFNDLQAALPGRIGAAATRAGVRHVTHVSAIGADPDSPAAYGRSKAAGEAALRAAYPGAVILRPSVVFGPEDDFFNRFATLARFSPSLPLIGEGETKLQPVYVGDLAAAIMAGLTRHDLAGRTFELGGPRVYSLKEIMELVLRYTGRDRLLVPLSFTFANLVARFTELLPKPPLTRDQVALLGVDNIVAEGADGLAALGVTPTSVEAIVPAYLDRFRKGGRFAPATTA